LEAVFSETIVMIVLCSPASISRPWITFETGCGWIKRLPILVLCHSNQKMKHLPLPFNRFQALELEDSSFISEFLKTLANRLGFKRAPRIDQNLMHKELSHAVSIMDIATIQRSQSDSSNMLKLPEDAINFLRHLAQSACSVSVKQISDSFNIEEQRAMAFLDTLCQVNLVTRGQILGAPSIYTINSGGKKYLSSLGLY
jgi:hypothetical protein